MAWNEHSVIAEATTSFPGVTMIRLPDEEQPDVLRQIMDRFLFASDAAWWWEVLNEPSLTLGGHSVSDIPKVCPDPHAPIYFVPCDTRPLVVYRTTPHSTELTLNECPFFEYALVALDLSWMIIENHHGAFIVAGQIERLNIARSKLDTLNR